MPPQVGHVYTGVVNAVAGVCFVKAPWMTEPRALFLVLLWIFTVAMSVPTAIVSDTLVLPIDLYISARAERTTFSQYCSYHAQDYLTEPKG